MAGIERARLRLLDGYRSIESARVAPHFVLMGGGYPPRAGERGFVLIKRQIDREGDLAQSGGKIEIGRSVVNRIGAQNEECIDLSSRHVCSEFGNRLTVRAHGGCNRLNQSDRASERSERTVERIGKHVNLGRLLAA